MNTPLISLLRNIVFALTASICLTACPEDETTTQTAAATGNSRRAVEEGEDEPSDRQPRLGMSTRQIKAMYGEANDIHHSSRGEVWRYWFNRGQMFIPYNFGYKPRTGTFTFNDNGTLVDFEYNE